jgi:hypothetical protein
MASVLLPIATLLLTGYALRPREALAPRRLALIRAALAVGGYAIVGVEVLSSVHAISAGPIVALWSIGLLASAVLALGRYRRDGAAGWRWRPTLALRRPSVAGLLIAGLAGLIAAELLLALVSPPNNYDSNYYHLPKVEHWVAQRSVELYPTLMRPQVVLAPGAEYLLLHLRLMTGGDRLYNLVQWAAALGCVLVASRIAAQLGAGRLGQVLAAATVAAAPVVVLEATSTQNDLVVAAWVLCTASLVVDELRLVDELRRRSGWAAVLGVGTSAGLTVVTKPTGWLALAPVLVLWGVAQLRPVFRRGRQDRHNFPEVVASDGSRGHYFREVVPIIGRMAAGALAIFVLIGVLAGPYLIRVDREFGSPLGPPEQSAGLALQRHDPAAILVNALRIGASTLAVPAPALNRAVAGAVIDFAHAIHIDPEDPAITVVPQYPNPRWWPDEDHSPYPVQSALVLLATFGVLVAPRVPGQVRAYALMVLGTLVAYAAVLKWQPWGNRLVSTALLLGAPLVGWALPWFVGFLRAVPLTRLAAAGLGVVVAGGVADGYYAVVLGAPRPLAGAQSVLFRDEWDIRFARLPTARQYYEWGADQVRASGARRVGIVVRGDQWEYPWWRLLPGTKLVALESTLPHHPPAPATSVDAILCAAPPDACRFFVPAGWRFEERVGWFGVAVPGSAPRPSQSPGSAPRPSQSPG